MSYSGSFSFNFSEEFENNLINFISATQKVENILAKNKKQIENLNVEEIMSLKCPCPHCTTLKDNAEFFESIYLKQVGGN